MEMIAYTIVAGIIYVASDRLLDRIEIHLGRRLQQRSLIFFVIITTLAIASFSLIQQFAPD
ncbi:conserved hypothetical protein [Azospirillaceae bacterium]